MADVSAEDDAFIKKKYAEVFGDPDHDVEKFYTELAPVFDKFAKIIQFPGSGFRKAIEEVQRLNPTKDLTEFAVMDIGCGTGRFGDHLKENSLTFKQLDGLDISKGILEVCEAKKIYNRLINKPLTADPTEGIEENYYDMAFSFGCFIENHIPMQCVNEMIRMVKPGGYVIITLHDPNYTLDYMAVMGEVIKKKSAELVRMELFPYKRDVANNYEFLNGYLVTFKVL